MKQALRFQSEQEFQSFFGQLASAEIPGFQAIEGSGGDGGFDGITESTAFQVYFPEDKNRTDKNYISKIATDLEKVIKSSKTLGLQISEWVFVVPEDLRIGVVAYLLNKTKETGIKCSHWGATKLTELVTKHPHIQDSFPTVFLPPVREGIQDIQDFLEQGQKPRVLTSVEIVGDQEFIDMRNAITEEYHEKTKSFMRMHRESSSAHLVADMAYKKEADKKTKELFLKKEKSDKAYKLESDEINEYYEEQVIKLNDEMAKRGIPNSGIHQRQLGLLEIKKNRYIDRLNLKYGKDTQTNC